MLMLTNNVFYSESNKSKADKTLSFAIALVNQAEPSPKNIDFSIHAIFSDIIVMRTTPNRDYTSIPEKDSEWKGRLSKVPPNKD